MSKEEFDFLNEMINKVKDEIKSTNKKDLDKLEELNKELISLNKDLEELKKNLLPNRKVRFVYSCNKCGNKFSVEASLLTKNVYRTCTKCGSYLNKLEEQQEL